MDENEGDDGADGEDSGTPQLRAEDELPVDVTETPLDFSALCVVLHEECLAAQERGTAASARQAHIILPRAAL